MEVPNALCHKRTQRAQSEERNQITFNRSKQREQREDSNEGVARMNGRQTSIEEGHKDFAFRIPVLSVGSCSKPIFDLFCKPGGQTESWQDRIIKTELCLSR